jgi:DNA polymerase (family 10)
MRSAFYATVNAPVFADDLARCVALGDELRALLPWAATPAPARPVTLRDWPAYDQPRQPAAVAPDKMRHTLAAARAIADELLAHIAPGCTRAIVAGSIRRGKATVGDIEILYCPRGGEADAIIEGKVARGELVIRGGYGPKNKFLRHIPSGIKVDLFATDEAAWWNSLVWRTGPAESNIAIAQAARSQGRRWHPAAAGFSVDGKMLPATSEAEVFALAGLPWRAPEMR